jgi:thioredoxin 1
MRRLQVDPQALSTHLPGDCKFGNLVMSANTVAVTDKSFPTDVVEASKNGPVLVDFWAEWCGPCKMIAPALEELAGEYAGKLTVAKVDIDNNPMVPSQFAVRGIPTLILFKDGKPAATQVGALPKSKLKDWIAGNI